MSESAGRPLCQRCKGSGEIEVMEGVGDQGYPTTVECPTCKGTGVTPSPAGPDALAEVDPKALKLATDLVEWAESHGTVDGHGMTRDELLDFPEMIAVRQNTIEVCRELIRLSRSRPAQDRDAERYRWLNKQYDFLAYVTGTDGQKTYRLRCGPPLDAWIDRELDEERARADAAMSQQEKRDG